jgi:hypothetical protein
MAADQLDAVNYCHFFAWSIVPVIRRDNGDRCRAAFNVTRRVRQCIGREVENGLIRRAVISLGPL